MQLLCQAMGLGRRYLAEVREKFSSSGKRSSLGNFRNPCCLKFRKLDLGRLEVAPVQETILPEPEKYLAEVVGENRFFLEEGPLTNKQLNKRRLNKRGNFPCSVSGEPAKGKRSSMEREREQRVHGRDTNYNVKCSALHECKALIKMISCDSRCLAGMFLTTASIHTLYHRIT